jgi:hypothetical protein
MVGLQVAGEEANQYEELLQRRYAQLARLEAELSADFSEMEARLLKLFRDEGPLDGPKLIEHLGVERTDRPALERIQEAIGKLIDKKVIQRDRYASTYSAIVDPELDREEAAPEEAAPVEEEEAEEEESEPEIIEDHRSGAITEPETMEALEEPTPEPSVVDDVGRETALPAEEVPEGHP